MAGLTNEQLQLLKDLKARGAQSATQGSVATPQAQLSPQQPEQQSGFLNRAIETGQDFSSGVVKSFGQTALGIGRFGRNIQNKLGMNVGNNNTGIFDFGSEANNKARDFVTPDNTAEKVGKFVGTAAQYAIPGSQTSRVQSLLGKMGAEFATGFTVGGLQEAGANEKWVKKAVIEGAIGAAVPVAVEGLKFTGRFLKGLAGSISKQGDEVLSTIINNPDDALRVLNQNQDDAAIELATKIAKGVEKYDAQTANTFNDLIAGASKQKVNLVTGSVDDLGRSSPALKESVETTLSEFGVVIDDAGELVFTNQSSLVKPSEQNIVKKIISQLDELGDAATPSQINDTATGISKLRLKGDADINDVVDAVRRTVREVAEEADTTGSIASANIYYNDRKDLINVFKKISRINHRQGALKTGEVSRERLRDIANSLNQFFSERKFLDRVLIDEFENVTGERILGEAAGLQMGSRIGEASGDLGLSVFSAALPPQKIGRTAARFGQAQNIVNSLPINFTNQTKSAIQALIAEELGNTNQSTDQYPQ